MKTRAILTIITLVLIAAAPWALSQEAPLLEIRSTGLDFTAPSEVPSGWTTVRFDNASSMIHFAALQRLPEGVGLADQQREVAPVFQEGYDLLAAGEFEAADAKFGELPAWFGEVVFFGGPGLTSAGHASEVIVDLRPGRYLIECYVKTGGVFHSYNPDPDVYGMIFELTVSDDGNGAAAPVSTAELTISSEGGIQGPDVLQPGRQVVAVNFEDQTVHEHFLGHDVHVVRVEDDLDLEQAAEWMNWTLPGSLETPAPVEFLGGIGEMPAGETGYLVLDLEPGEYAWVAEVPDPAGKGMLKTFTVTPRDAN